MKHIYLFDETDSKGAVYGVNTYIQALLLCLKNSGIRVTVCKLMANHPEVTIDQRTDARYIYIPKPKDLSLNRKYYYRNVAFLLYEYIDRTEYILFHFNYLSCKNLAKELLRHIPARCILTIHYRQLHTSENPEAEKEFINDYCDRVIVLAQHAFRSLCSEYETPPEKIRVIPNGLADAYQPLTEEEKKRIRRLFGFTEKEKLILYAGRLDANKNVAILIRAFLLLIGRYADCRLVIVGAGDYQTLLQKITGSWGKITLTGFLDKKTLFDLYRIADIGVIPSLYEEFGYVAVEMMMHGLPVIANRTSGLSEIIENGVSGKTVDLTTDACLANILEEWLCRESVRARYAENARRRFMEKYDHSLFKQEMMNLYNDFYSKYTI